MSDIIYIPTPITQKPEKDGYFLVFDPAFQDSGRCLYFFDGDWYENEWEAKGNEHCKSYDVDDNLWLRPAKLSEVIGEAWDAAGDFYERFIDKSQDDKPMPLDKTQYINSKIG